jgi:preprotein translocase subunit SecA
VLQREAEQLWMHKEQEIGIEMYENVQRFIALQSVDSLWMEHLDTMDHLRDSVRLRGYGQRDPLVEYKKEGFQAFQRLIAEINKQIVYTVLKISMQVQQPAQSTQANLVTNLSGDSAAGKPKSNSITETGHSIGRNDPCNCNSGKKWKKCGLLNTAEHQQNMIRA